MLKKYTKKEVSWSKPWGLKTDELFKYKLCVIYILKISNYK